MKIKTIFDLMFGVILIALIFLFKASIKVEAAKICDSVALNCCLTYRYLKKR